VRRTIVTITTPSDRIEVITSVQAAPLVGTLGMTKFLKRGLGSGDAHVSFIFFDPWAR
jgi:hypothetical protein